MLILAACGGTEGNNLTGDGGANDGGGSDVASNADTSTSDTSTIDAPDPMDVAPDMRMDSTMVSLVGCSDGTREAFTSTNTHPNIAGCSGGWSIPGVTTQASLVPTCNRNSGNSSNNQAGTGCSVEDLCAVGWHVCNDAQEVGMRSGTGKCDTISMLSSTNFWTTRQSMDQNLNCAPNSHNNFVGCTLGNLGTLQPGQGCAPLDSAMYYASCQANPPWQCGNQNTAQNEADLVTKTGSDHGGVICCRN